MYTYFSYIPPYEPLLYPPGFHLFSLDFWIISDLVLKDYNAWIMNQAGFAWRSLLIKRFNNFEDSFFLFQKFHEMEEIGETENQLEVLIELSKFFLLSSKRELPSW